MLPMLPLQSPQFESKLANNAQTVVSAKCLKYEDEQYVHQADEQKHIVGFYAND